MQIVSKVEEQQIEKTEQQQIESSMMKKHLLKQTPVVTEQVQKVFCHSCPTRVDLITKKFFYTFPDGKPVFFCNAQEKNEWLDRCNLNS